MEEPEDIIDVEFVEFTSVPLGKKEFMQEFVLNCSRNSSGNQVNASWWAKYALEAWDYIEASTGGTSDAH